MNFAPLYAVFSLSLIVLSPLIYIYSLVSLTTFVLYYFFFKMASCHRNPAGLRLVAVQAFATRSRF